MPNVTGVISRAIRKRFDWNRIGIAVGVLIVILAAFVLFQLLRDIDADKVVAALQAKSIRDVLIASGFVAIGYATLTLYDFFALRTIGRDAVPYRVAALTGFTAYTFGHNFGATVVTAGLIRLRIYSAWGLSVIDIVKIAFFTGLARLASDLPLPLLHSSPCSRRHFAWPARIVTHRQVGNRSQAEQRATAWKTRPLRLQPGVIDFRMADFLFLARSTAPDLVLRPRVDAP
jgi:hypothetical protein